ncbi:Universal stress protein family 4 [Caenispirillum salinarum AK4]|uniref:Universal stress protein family 4 n=1 Tax=Caenispirillum salinarum AK4 TaxID=1238182 RepID=K9HKB0_9PROT|nr:universal stress protein [Caenispirillum salinarum]EKV30793.1 Universal stress protein family 4 [Caenispirillum salinarum AK4]
MADKKILACTDGSAPYAASVYDHAAWAAKRIDASVEILHVLDHHSDRKSGAVDLSGSIGMDARDELLEQLAELDNVKAKVAQKRARLILEDAEKRLTAAGVSEVSLTQRHGTVVETVDEFEDAANLIVIGKRGETHDVASEHLGANLERVVRASRRPVLVASRAFKPIEKVLIAFDGSPSARRAVEAIGKSPLLKGLACHVLSVGYDGSERREQMTWATDTLKTNGIEAEAVVRQGDADDVITAYVRDEGINLMVMGAYGHSRIRSFIVGSTTTTMIRTCKIPLLMVR